MKSIGNNSGYIGFSKSRRAAKAEQEGRYPLTTFTKEYHLTKNSLAVLMELGYISNTEWHHTSKAGNITKYYSWNSPSDADIYLMNKKAIDLLARTKTEGYEDNITAIFDDATAAQRLAMAKELDEIKKSLPTPQAAPTIQPEYEYHLDNDIVVVTNGNPNWYAWDVFQAGEKLTKRHGKSTRDAARQEVKDIIANQSKILNS